MMKKITIESIRQECERDGWQLISQQYINLNTELEFRCKEGHSVFAPWQKMRAKRVCPQCKANKVCDMVKEVIPKARDAYRILALDQATHSTGWAIFENSQLLKYGTFESLKDDDEIARDAYVRQWLISVIENWGIDMCFIEGIQFQESSGSRLMGATVFQALARLQGILMLTCFEAHVPYEVCPTNTWRHVCGIKGKSRIDRKRSAQLLIKQEYDITVGEDEADAICIGRYGCAQHPQPKISNQIPTVQWE